MTKVAVIGTTRWGTTLAIMLARQKQEVALWARTEDEAERLNQEGENKERLPGFPFPPGLKVTNSLDKALDATALVIIAVPSVAMRTNVRQIRDCLPPQAIIMSATKGLELATIKRMSQVMKDELPPNLHPQICVLSGPNLSWEIASGMPAATVVAASELQVAKGAQEIMMTPLFRVYTNTDVIGVELGGSLKNVIALGAGMADGLGYGSNAKAAFMTRGLAEITRLGAAAGANPLTFAGLAGFGDLVTTCCSPLSRNHTAGAELAKGRTLANTRALLTTVEGVNTTTASLQLAQSLGVEMPITEQIYRVLFEDLAPRQAVAQLMGRQAKGEWQGMANHEGRRWV
ncbi:MAG: NAD(P)-dependent glycerol-3-phosphate dehydrogenase [Chloroflexi bacterium]|nr:NAD(P)-dependent glycerol-3-phosphate dehydrogenase [Chloroflexota bacterium]